MVIAKESVFIATVASTVERSGGVYDDSPEWTSVGAWVADTTASGAAVSAFLS